MARVRGVMRSAMACGEMLKSSPMSASTGVAPWCRMTFTVAQKVSGVVITSSPGPISKAASARWSPAVQELTAWP